MTFIFYCMSSTCMLLKMMEKSRNSVCSPKQNSCWGFRRKKKNLHKQWAGKIFSASENPPYPITFLKKYTFYFWGRGWAIFLSNTIFATNLLPVCFAWIALHYIFWSFFFVQDFFFGNCPPPPAPIPSPSQIKNISPTIGNLASSRVKPDCVTYKWREVKRHFRFESLIFRN